MFSKFDVEKAGKNLDIIINKIQSETDAVSLIKYRKIFYKKIPFFKRKWAAAWLLMYYDGKETPADYIPGITSDVKEKKSVFSGKKAADKTTDFLAYMSEEESKWLFVSIGRNCRLYPKDVISLICSKTSAAKEDIGSIRILNNYSFIQVRGEKADEIISSLNDQLFRGRTIAVNYAKPKADSV